MSGNSAALAADPRVRRARSNLWIATDGPGTLRVAGIAGESVVDGPGLRAVLFLQGCPHHCPGCHNPDTWDPRGGREMTAAEIWRRIEGGRLLRGVTFSGGEPFLQAGPLIRLAERIKDRGWDLLIYTGYTWEELSARRRSEWEFDRLLALADYLVDGPYLERERRPGLAFRGSSNQRLLDLRRTEAAGRPILWEPTW